MKKIVEITETYKYEVEVEAESCKEAISKAQKIYEEYSENYFFSADPTNFDATYFLIK